MSCFRHGVFSFSSSCLANTLGGSAQGPTHVFTSKFLAKEEEASSSAWLRRACLMWEVKRSVTFLFFFLALTGTCDLQHRRNVFTWPFDSVETATDLQQTVGLWMRHGRAPCVLITVYGRHQGHEKWSARPSIIQCGCVYFGTARIHLLKAE